MVQSSIDPPLLGIYSGLDLIGDGLTKLPFLRAARAAFPDHRIVYVTSGPTVLETILRPLCVGLIDEFVSETGILRSNREFFRPLPVPLRRRFAVFLDTQPVVMRTLLLRRIPHRLFVTNCARFLLSDRRPGWLALRPANLADRLIQLVELASGRPASFGGGITVPAAAAELAERLLPAGPRYVGLAPGAGGRHKCWPLAHYVALGAALGARGLAPVFLLGPAEAEWQEEIAAGVPGAVFPLQARAVLGPRFDPLHTVALARRLAAAVANDSGVNQLLAAADVPLLTLFGPTNAVKFRPKVSRGTILAAQAFGGTEMAAIPLPAVLTSVLGLLSE